MPEDETIEPLLSDTEEARTRQRAAGVGAVVGAVLGSRRGPVAAGISAGVGSAVGYVVGDLLQRRTDEQGTVQDGHDVTVDSGDSSVTVETDADETAGSTGDDAGSDATADGTTDGDDGPVHIEIDDGDESEQTADD
ncbi:MAG: hypothetical protein ABEH80_08945, partial [Halobaculum sp.]